jgi:hypothetical protein
MSDIFRSRATLSAFEDIGEIMQKISAILFALISYCSACPTLAKTIYFDCDARSEHFSHIKMTQSGPHHQISGKITASTLARSSRYAPAATATLASEDGSQSIWVRMIGPMSSKDYIGQGTVDLGIMSRVDGAPFKEERFAKADMHQAIDFSIDANENGHAIIRFGGVERRVPFKVTSQVIAGVSCSTGQFTFSDLDLGGD